MIPDDEDDESFKPQDPVAPPAEEESDPVASPEQSTEAPGTGPMTTQVDLGHFTHVIPEDTNQPRLTLMMKCSSGITAWGTCHSIE